MEQNTPDDPERIEIIYALATGATPHGSKGKIAHELGDFREHATLDLVRRAMHGFTWALRARRATPTEDADGKDIIIETDRGELYVQVKSSTVGADAWRKKYGDILGQRAFVVVWTDNAIPSQGFIAQEIQRAYAAARRDGNVFSQNSLPTVTRAAINTLPDGFRCLFDPTGKLLKTVTGPYLDKLIKAYDLALAREQEKRLRMDIANNNERRLLRRALAIAIKALRSTNAHTSLDEIFAIIPESINWTDTANKQNILADDEARASAEANEHRARKARTT